MWMQAVSPMCRVDTTDSDIVLSHHNRAILRVNKYHAPSVAAFGRLMDSADLRGEVESFEVLALLEYMREILRSNLAIVWKARSPERSCAGTCIPKYSEFVPRNTSGRRPISVRPHVFFRPAAGDEILIDCPFADAQVLLPQKMLAKVNLAIQTNAPADMLDSWCVNFLGAAGIIRFADEEESPWEQYWEFHDAVFHSESRMQDGKLQGGTYRFLGKTSPESASPGLSVPRRIPANPNLLPPNHHDGSCNLRQLLARRKSTRTFSNAPIPIDRLALLLRSCFETAVIGKNNEQEVCSRPYPSGGALYETEPYIVVNNCDGLTRGTYRYDGTIDEFDLVAPASAAADRLLERARWSCPPMHDPPAVLLVLTARISRIAWKYESIAYRTALLNAGVVLQTLYLLCEDLGLGCCAVGLGDSRGFEDATGIDRLMEPSIAEMVLGLPAS